MKPIVVKTGGSTLGNRDTTLEDLLELQEQGMQLRMSSLFNCQLHKTGDCDPTATI